MAGESDPTLLLMFHAAGGAIAPYAEGNDLDIGLLRRSELKESYLAAGCRLWVRPDEGGDEVSEKRWTPCEGRTEGRVLGRTACGSKDARKWRDVRAHDRLTTANVAPRDRSPHTRLRH